MLLSPYRCCSSSEKQPCSTAALSPLTTFTATRWRTEGRRSTCVVKHHHDPSTLTWWLASAALVAFRQQRVKGSQHCVIWLMPAVYNHQGNGQPWCMTQLQVSWPGLWRLCPLLIPASIPNQNLVTCNAMHIHCLHHLQSLQPSNSFAFAITAAFLFLFLLWKGVTKITYVQNEYRALENVGDQLLLHSCKM